MALPIVERTIRADEIQPFYTGTNIKAQINVNFNHNKRLNSENYETWVVLIEHSIIKFRRQNIKHSVSFEVHTEQIKIC